MSAYRMTPARAAALKKAQAASAAKRRRLHNRNRRIRRAKIAAVGAVAVGGLYAAARINGEVQHNRFITDPVNRKLIERHITIARFQNERLNLLRAPQPPRVFDEKAAWEEVYYLLRMKKVPRSRRT